MRTSHRSLRFRGLAVAGSLAVSFVFSQSALAAAWVAQSPGTSAVLMGAAFANDGYGVAVGNSNRFFITSDGGKSWAPTAYTAPSAIVLDVTMTPGGIAFAVGGSGMVVKGTSALDWNTLYPDTAANLWGVDCVSDTVCWVVGSNGAILKTTNGGTNWVPQTSNTTNELLGVDFVNSEVGWAVGRNGRVVKTTNGGTTWTAQSSGTESDLYAVEAVDSNTVWVGGTVRAFRKTTNGGTSWSPVTLDAFPAGVAINDILFRNAAEGYVVADSGWLAQTTNGGSSWGSMVTNTSNAFRGLAASTHYIWAVGDGGTVRVYDGTGPAAPGSFAVSPQAITNDTTPNFNWDAAVDAVSTVSDYAFKVDSGFNMAIGDVLTHTPSALTQGIHTVYVMARDIAGNYGAESSMQVTVDTTAPTVSTITPTSATAGVAVELSASVSDSLAGIDSCMFYLNGSPIDGQGSVMYMSYSSVTGIAKRTQTFSSAGTYTAYARCTDKAGNITSGSTVSVVVSAAPVDTTAPAVTNLAPSTATMNAAATVSANVSDNVGVSSCELFVNDISQGAMTVAGGIASRSHTFIATGNYSVRATCRDAAANSGSQTVTTVVSAPPAVDTTAPTVMNVAPTTATVNVAANVTATVSDNVGISSCTLSVDNVSQGVMTVVGNTASRSHVFTSVGDRSVKVTCTDAAANSAFGTVTTVVSAAPATDTSAPTVSNVAPTTATVNVAANVTATVSDNVGISSCTLSVNNVSQGAMSIVGNTASKSYTFTSAGNHTTKVTCTDAAQNSGSATVTTVVAGGAADVTPPSVGTPWPTTARVDTAISLYAAVSDNVGISSCTLFIDGNDRGTMDVAGGIASKQYTFPGVGSYNVYVRCRDAATNSTAGLTAVVTALAATVDSSTPSAMNSSVSLNPSTVPADGASTSIVTVVVRNSSGVALAGKTVTLSTSRYSYDTIKALSTLTNDLGQASFSIKSTGTGSSVVTAVSDGLIVGSATVTWSAASSAIGPGSLIKFACPAVVPVNHPCTAVYYYGADGRRHAFPNDKVYGTWFTGFGSVKTVSESFIASLPLGTNVTYRPGMVLIKFQSLSTVYAISKGGVLRAISSEAVARALYGDGWASKVHDMSDIFFMNYTYGSDVANSTGYTPADETASVSSIDSNF